MSEVLGFMLGSAWQARRRRRRALDELETSGTVESGLRVLSGDVPGLTWEWTHGSWTVTPGRLALASTVVVVTGVEAGCRRPSAQESWNLNPDAEVVVLLCPSGRVEWALLPACREAAVQRLLG